MSSLKIDARGFACPEPVIMIKKATSNDFQVIEALVDNNTAKENIKRFASSKKLSVEVKKINDDYKLTITK